LTVIILKVEASLFAQASLNHNPAALGSPL
jgi:hypothetical protein